MLKGESVSVEKKKEKVYCNSYEFYYGIINDI